MRFWVAVMAVVVGVSLSGVAEQNAKPFKAKPTGEFKVKDQSNEGKHARTSVAPATGANSSAKNLQAIEREGARSHGASHTARKVPASAVKPPKTQRNPKIDFSRSTSSGTGLNHTGNNPYRRRLKTKAR